MFEGQIAQPALFTASCIDLANAATAFADMSEGRIMAASAAGGAAARIGLQVKRFEFSGKRAALRQPREKLRIGHLADVNCGA